MPELFSTSPDRFSPQWRQEFNALAAEALEALDPSSAIHGKLHAAVQRAQNPAWRMLVSGLRSVGKSSFVCALWGDSQLLPTAERDCTQVNTLTRLPANGEADNGLRLEFLRREAAVDFATRGLAFYRLSGLLQETLGPMGPNLDDMPKEKRIEAVVEAVQKLFREQPKLLVLNETLTDDLEELEEFLRFINSLEYKAGQTVGANWDERRDNLMGRRRPDGRPIDLGKLAALQHVEIIRASERWPRDAAAAPQLVDTPYIPTLHSARRADLILAQAREADLLLIVARAAAFELEDWLKHFLREKPAIAARTLVLFNQIDTVDTSVLFARDGFARAFEQNAERLAQAGIKRGNLFISCARLPFLRGLPPDDATGQRVQKLRAVLERLRKQADLQPNNEFKRRLLAACNENDAGIESLRARMLSLAANELPAWRALDVLAMLDTEEFAVAPLKEIAKRARGLAVQIAVASRTPSL